MKYINKLLINNYYLIKLYNNIFKFFFNHFLLNKKKIFLFFQKMLKKLFYL